MLMVSVNIGNDKAGKPQDPIVGLLIDTHLMPVSGPPKASIDPGGKLVQSQGPQGLQGMGVVATDKGFLVGPLASMTPIMNPAEEESDGEVKAVFPEDVPTEDVPTELQSGAGRKEEGE